MRKIKYLRMVTGFAVLALLLGLVGNGVIVGGSTMTRKGVIVGDKS